MATQRTESEIKEGRYGLRRFPPELRLWVWKKATARAGWKNEREIGEGSSMMMEWITFAITKDRWLQDIENHLGPLPDDLRAKLFSISG